MIASNTDITFLETQIDRWDLYHADSLLLVGTSIELAVADHIDHFQLPGSPLVPSLFNKFFEILKIDS